MIFVCNLNTSALTKTHWQCFCNLSDYINLAHKTTDNHGIRFARQAHTFKKTATITSGTQQRRRQAAAGGTFKVTNAVPIKNRAAPKEKKELEY